MKEILKHSQWMILELLRAPAYVVSTIAFPALFYVIFAIPESKDAFSSNLLVASFSCFSVFGVIFLQFGVGIAQERSKSWYSYIRTLPLESYKLMIARFISALFFSFLATMGIVILALFFTKVDLSFFQWIQFISILHVAGLAFCFMGLALGYWTNEKSSLPIGNLIYLPLSFAGGLWKPPNILPEMLKDISEYLPTRYYGEILWTFVRGDSIKASDIGSLFIYALAFALLAFVGFRRDQGERLR
jgi:ABC-2 type transport system permease protein